VTLVRPVDRTGQAGGYNSRTKSVPESLSNFFRPWNKNTPKTQPARKENSTQNLAKQLQTDQELTSSTIPKSIPLTHRFGRGIKGKRTTKGSHIFPPSNPQEQGPENTPKTPPREGFENHHQAQPGTTQESLEEPRRIIYTYKGGSYKV
jgi:hypothetical protein